ncbi:MAG: Hsp20 family protein, partial [Mesorhizobium sp.]
MRTNPDFTPLFRSSVGFDRIFNMLEDASRVSTIDNWPPYDIAKVGEDDYRITMAVAGFSRDELTITHQPNMLVVSGSQTGEDNGEYLYRGIA